MVGLVHVRLLDSEYCPLGRLLGLRVCRILGEQRFYCVSVKNIFLILVSVSQATCLRCYSHSPAKCDSLRLGAGVQYWLELCRRLALSVAVTISPGCLGQSGCQWQFVLGPSRARAECLPTQPGTAWARANRTVMVTRTASETNVLCGLHSESRSDSESG